MSKKGYLHLADGTIVEGMLMGALRESMGEVVFSTGMVGYVESLSDPSFAGQILTFTYPLIGNYGVSKKQTLQPHLMGNRESERIWVQGVIVSELVETPSHHTSFQSFNAWCKEMGVPILAGIDTRALTIKMREHGVLMGKISSVAHPPDWKESVAYPYHQTSIAEVITYKPNKANGKKIALIDCGVKHGIVRSLLSQGYRVTRVPYNTNPLDIDSFDGVVVSNGPGDPKDWQITIDIIKKILQKNIPFVGVCLGHQLLALAVGADTYKLKYGHRGLNQPVQDVFSKRCYLTSQNHGFAVDSATIPKGFSEWFVNLNDRTNEGIRSDDKKVWTSQFHPEGNPGPFDSEWIFKKFL